MTPPSATKPAAAPRRRRLSADARKEQIVAAARRVFVRSGLAGARTKDIAAEAGINEALLYRHFSSKEELFEAAVGGPLEAAVAAVIAFSGEPPPEFDATGEHMHARTKSFVRDLLGAMDEISPLLGIMLFGDSGTASRYFRERIAPSLDSVSDVVVANLAAWQHRDFDPALVVESVFGMVWFHALTDRLTGRTSDPDAVAEQITSMLLYGLGQPGGSA